jgi:anaerobic magnesium-protoporphyrin IX monomethyl ester cyclase
VQKNSMTDVLLTHSYHLPNDAKQMRKMQPYPPLGTLYAATALRAAGISVAIFDSTFSSPISGFADALEEYLPKIVVIYEDDFNFVTKMCLSHMRELANQLSMMAHAKGITVIAHGSDATDHPAEYLDNGVDYVLNGEAERTLTDLCAALLRSKDPGVIAGLVQYTEPGKKLIHGAHSPKNPSWVNLPRIARELIDMEPYRKAWLEKHGYFSTNVVSSRGCPYHCNWCAKPISGDKFHIRAPEDVAAEIRELRDVYGVEHIWFGDDVFALNRHWVEAFANAVESQGSPVPFKIQSRADLMSEVTVSALKRAGCIEIWMGVESGSQKILDTMGKGLRLPAIYAARERLSRASIRACYFLQFGYTGEGWHEICETVRLVRETRPDDIGVSISYPLPGTVFFNRVKTQLGHKQNWTDSDDLCAIFTAAYTDEFYHALRDALHAEVSEWHTPVNTSSLPRPSELFWSRVIEMESASLNPNVLLMPTESFSEEDRTTTFIPLDALVRTGGV